MGIVAAAKQLQTLLSIQVVTVLLQTLPVQDAIEPEKGLAVLLVHCMLIEPVNAPKSVPRTR